MMNKLKTPPSGPHDLEELCKQIEAYKQKPGVIWADTAVKRNAPGLYTVLRRFAEANTLTSRSAVVKKLGHPFERALRRAFDLEEFKQRCLAYKARAQQWQPYTLLHDEEGKTLHNALLRLGTYWFGLENKKHIWSVAERLGIPFEGRGNTFPITYTIENVKADIATYLQTPQAQWTDPRTLKRGTALEQRISAGLDALAARTFRTGTTKTVRRMAARLGHPFPRPQTVTPCKLRKRIQQYLERPGTVWQPTHLRNGTDEERGLYNDLLLLARKQKNSTGKKGLKPLAARIAAELGHPFLSRTDHPHQLPLAAPQPARPEPRAPKYDKTWLFKQFERIHPTDKETGQRTYLKPYHVKQKERAVVSWATMLCGSLKDAMEEWHPGSYAASLGRYTTKEYPDEKLEASARSALTTLFAENGFVSREELRIVHGAAYHPVEALRKRKKLKEYKEILHQLGVSPTELTSEEKKKIGYFGELFSLAYFYLLMRANIEDIAELHPRHPGASKIEVLAPSSKKGLIVPDIARGNGDALYLTETKAGGALPLTTAERILEKYQGSFNVEGDSIPVAFKDVHLHMPRKHIEDGALELFKEHDIAVLIAEDIALAFVRYQAPPELQEAYRTFAYRPVWFIQNTSTQLLESRVTALTPDRFQPRDEPE